MIKRLPSVSIIAEVRRRLSRLSSERHTSQRQPITGTPCDVPVPKNVSFIATKIVNKTKKASTHGDFSLHIVSFYTICTIRVNLLNLLQINIFAYEKFCKISAFSPDSSSASLLQQGGEA